jgi:hypothetical protein
MGLQASRMTVHVLGVRAFGASMFIRNHDPIRPPGHTQLRLYRVETESTR